MSKRAEDAALKVYPPETNFVEINSLRFVKTDRRAAYIKGYEQAEKDTLERVILWLKDNANKYIVNIGLGYGEHGRNVELVVGGKCWDDLKKAMEEE